MQEGGLVHPRDLAANAGFGGQELPAPTEGPYGLRAVRGVVTLLLSERLDAARLAGRIADLADPSRQWNLDAQFGVGLEVGEAAPETNGGGGWRYLYLDEEESRLTTRDGKRQLLLARTHRLKDGALAPLRFEPNPDQPTAPIPFTLQAWIGRKAILDALIDPSGLHHSTDAGHLVLLGLGVIGVHVGPPART